MTRTPIVFNYTTKVREILQDIDVFATLVNRLHCVIRKAFRYLDLDLGPGELKSQGLRLIVQNLESQHQDLKRLGKDYYIIDKNKVRDPTVADGSPTMNVFNNSAQYPAHINVENRWG